MCYLVEPSLQSKGNFICRIPVFIFQSFSELIQMGRLKPSCTDVALYEVDGQAQLAELSLAPPQVTKEPQEEINFLQCHVGLSHFLSQLLISHSVQITEKPGD